MFKKLRPAVVGTIVRRELLDVLRDRRTIFMMIVFPVMLYPLIGYVLSNLAMTIQEKKRVVVLINTEALPDEPALLSKDKSRFAPELFQTNPQDARLLEVKTAESGSPWTDPEKRGQLLRERVADLVVIIPDQFGKMIEEGKAGNLEYVYNSADDQAQMAYGKVQSVVSRWKDLVLARRLKADAKETDYVEPIREQVKDIATKSESSGQLWARILPFILVLMSLTGAFYPAIDLCAGEKERGTMETLLISPARRTEIVAAKFLTILINSLITAAMNLLSITLTGWKIMSDLASTSANGAAAMSSFSLPSSGIILIVFLILIPIAAFLSAVCLALAVMAKSMKEGQYYLTPIFMVAFPLTYMTLVPGVELSPVYALLPLTGTCLLLKSLLVGRLDQALPYILPVILPTMAYAWMALRWAVTQFESESVLFREAERFDLRSWFAWNIKHKSDRPSADQATVCFIMILLCGWFLAPFVPQFFGEAGKINPQSMIATQFLIIGMPPVLLALMLTKKPLEVLRLVRVKDRRYLILGLLLPLPLHPLVTAIYAIVEQLMPMSDTIKQLFEGLVAEGSLGLSLAAVAFAPGLCEELAFRGWIFSGLRTSNRPWATIIISSVLFGVIHVLLSAYQQFFHATILGLVLGILAYRSGSLWPCVIMHTVNNALAVLFSALVNKSPGLAGWIFSDPQSLHYRLPFVILSIPASLALIYLLFQLEVAEEGEPVAELLLSPIQEPA